MILAIVIISMLKVWNENDITLLYQVAPQNEEQVYLGVVGEGHGLAT